MRGGRLTFAISVALFSFGLGTYALAATPVAVRPDVASPAEFPAPGCGCHSQRVEEWSQSMHAKALVDPLFKAKLKQGEREAGKELGAFCLKCHGPIATMTGEAGGNMSPESAQAIGCMFCHQVVGLDGKPANTAQLVLPDGTRRAQLEDPQAPHPAVFSAFFKSAEFCGGCHNVDHPATKVHLESTYREWSESRYAKDGVVCQDCHMSSGGGARGPMKGTAGAGGPERDNIYRMSFVGANVGQGDAQNSAALLRSAAKVEISAPQVVAGGKEATAGVTITNVGAGHYLPTGLTEVREMWLSVSVEENGGSRREIGRHVFGTVLQDKNGTAPVEMWNAVGIKSDDRIPPDGSFSDEFAFKMPSSGEAKLSAVLNYRSAPGEMAKKAGVDNPTTAMASATAAVYTSAAEKNRALMESSAKEASGGGGSSLPLVIGGLAVVAVLGGAGFVTVRRRRSRQA